MCGCPETLAKGWLRAIPGRGGQWLRGGTGRELPSGRGRQAELLASSRHRIPPTIQFRGAEVSWCFAMQLLIAASYISSPTRNQ